MFTRPTYFYSTDLSEMIFTVCAGNIYIPLMPFYIYKVVVAFHNRQRWFSWVGRLVNSKIENDFDFDSVLVQEKIQNSSYLSDFFSYYAQGSLFLTVAQTFFRHKTPLKEQQINSKIRIILPYARHNNPLLIRNRSWILTIHKAKGHST